MGRKRDLDLEDEDDTSDDDEDSEPRSLFLIGDLDEDSCARLIRRIWRLSEVDAVRPIHLVVNTYGGSVDEAMAVYDAMKMCAAPIHTVGLGKVMSAGCLLLAAGTRGHRVLGANARLMYHGGTEVQGGDLPSQKNNVKEFERTERLYDRLVAKETGRSLSEVEKLYKPRRLDRYLSATQAKRFGFADRVST